MVGQFSMVILTACLLGMHVAATDEEVTFTAYSGNDCGTDDSKAFTEKSTQISTWKTTADEQKCAKTHIDLKDWPQADGKYKAFIDSKSIDDDCKLIFYDGPPSDDDADEIECFVPYREIQKDSGCATVSIPNKYGLVYCCGDNCGGSLPETRKRENKMDNRRDVTDIKRAPLYGRHEHPFYRKRGDDCKFDKSKGDIKTSYGKPKKAGSEVKCPDEAEGDCSITGMYTTSSSVSHAETNSDSITTDIGISAGFFSISESYGHEWSTTDESSIENSFSWSYELGVAPGTSGYLIFTPKNLCGKGSFDGDKCDDAIKIGEQEWCIPALIEAENGTQPDGQWGLFQTN